MCIYKIIMIRLYWNKDVHSSNALAKKHFTSKYKYYDLILLINLKCTSIESKVMIKYLDYKHRFQDAY